MSASLRFAKKTRNCEMATTVQTFSKMLKMLRENSSTKEKREALTYISSNARKLDNTGIIKEEQYKELCRLVIETFTNLEQDAQFESYDALSTIILDFKDHKLNLFDSLLQTNRKNRLKILKLLEVLDDSAISSAAKDTVTMHFLNDCMCTVQSHTMERTASTASGENNDMSKECEVQSLSDEQKLEEEMITYAVTLLRRLYKVAEKTTDDSIHRFDKLLMDKVVTLAYMGHKRQRGTALKLLKEAVTQNFGTHIRNTHPDVWGQYKSTLQSVYCKRMLHLVGACDIDWATQWNISIQFLGTDLHHGASLINNLLSVEEKAFKSTDSIIRRQAFLSWKLLVDNFALDPQELATPRRIKLLCIPLNAKNSKTELIALTKLEVWWHLIIKLYKDISKFVNPVITQFLNFCFGPLGDTPLLSTKFDVVASPGKRFSKTKVVAIDALRQFLVPKQEPHADFTGIFEERLPYAMSNAVFQECYKSIIHSVGEALLVLSQLTDKDMKNRFHVGKTLWTNLINYVRDGKTEIKNLLYKDIVLLIIELLNHATEKPLINDLILNLILIELPKLFTETLFNDDALSELVLKLFSTGLFLEMKRDHSDAVKGLLWQYVKANKGVPYHSNTLNLLGQIVERMQSVNVTNKSRCAVFEMWYVLAEILAKYIEAGENINEGDSTEHKFLSVQSVLSFPFTYISADDTEQAQEIVKTWRNLYIQFESQADLIATVRPNEIFSKVTDMVQSSLKKNKNCFCLAVPCTNVLLGTINYKSLFASGQSEVPSIMTLIVDLAVRSLSEKREDEAETALKALSAMLITAFGHDPEKAVSYLCASKPAIELVLESRSTSLYKEVMNVWGTVVSIFIGLNKHLTYDLLSSFREIILQAVSHPSSDVQKEALSIFKIREGLQATTRCLLEDIQKKVKQDKLLLKSDNIKKVESIEKSAKTAKMVNSFLCRKSESPKTILNKQTNKDEKKVPHSLDSDSEDYVFIKTDLNFDVNRLTENQKESLKRRRDDIPAMYNDLSQSSSQDTQQLQEWFSTKNKYIDAANKSDVNKKDNDKKSEGIDHEANKENKIEAVESGSGGSEKLATIVNEKKTETTKDIGDATRTRDEAQSENKPQHSDAMDDCPEVTTILGGSVPEQIDSDTPLSKLTAVRLDFESRDEFPEENVRKRQGSPSVLDCSKRRGRSSGRIATPTSTSDEAADVYNEQSSSNEVRVTKRTLRGKSEQNKALVKESAVIIETKRDLKRKSASDSDSDSGMHLRRRRKLLHNVETSSSDSNIAKSAESEISPGQADGGSDKESLNQRSKKEILRLKINMVFNSPPAHRRRSKELNKNSDTAAERRHCSPDGKGTKPKTTDVKSAEVAKDVKRVLKLPEKDTKVNTTQVTTTRRKRRSIKQDADKSEEHLEDESERNRNETKENKSQMEDTESIMDSFAEVPSSQLGQKTNSIAEKESAETRDSGNTPTDELEKQEESNENESLPDTKESPTDHNDTEDIVESSQEFNKTVKLEKKLNDKQYFITTHNIEKDRTESSQETTAAVTDLLESNIADNNTADKPTSSENLRDDIAQTDKTEATEDTRMEISEESCNTQHDETKSLPIEGSQKNNENSTLGKSISLIGQSSPKSNHKRYSKLKAYPTGRAAHMLGLVTKCGLMENEGAIVRIDDDSTSKKSKSKDAENESVKKEKTPVAKDVEKIGGPCGSRQEKIFSNMRTTDYNSSPPIKLFSNLKNDGEKISSKVEKRTADVTILGEQGSGKENEDNLSPLQEKDDLPMLEWSSANPPSLTASPSASILKRNRTIIPEPDTDSTPNKRKRVSFADPPVSKEMGYEITNAGSPHKINKASIPRTFLSRKDSPLRFKQTKLKFIQIDSERMEKESDLQEDSTSEVDLQCEKENELLSKIAEELEYPENMSMDVEPSTSCNYMDIDSMSEVGETISGTKVAIHSLEDELQIRKSSMSKRMDASQNEADVTKEINASGALEPEESETQQDIFSCDDRKNSLGVCETSANNVKKGKDLSFSANVSVDHLKMGLTNDSIITALPDDDSHSETLEDTVDVQNVTSLNFTANCEELFSGKLIRTSTQAAETAAEQDTLPVTESMIVSQDSDHIKQADTELCKEETGDPALPVFPSLASSSDPIRCVLRQLVNPSSVEHLSAYLGSKGLCTVGDLAKLSKSEDSKPSAKRQLEVDLVKAVLQHFESTCLTQQRISTDAKCASSTNTSVPNLTRESSALEKTSEDSLKTTGTNTDPIYITPRRATKSVASQMALEDLLDEIDVNLVLESAVRRCTPQHILSEYKTKMRHMPEAELGRETLRMIGIENKPNCSDVTLKSVCRACGVNKVLLRLPDIFSADKQFFAKVFKAYRQKIRASDCLEVLDPTELKEAICQKCTSSEIAQILSKRLQEEDSQGIKTPMTELSSLNAMLKRMPMDVIISHTVANDELIPSQVVLDIALQNNTSDDIMRALESRSPMVTKNMFEKLWSRQCVIKYIQDHVDDKEELLELYKAVSAKFTMQDLINASHESMRQKVETMKEEK